MSYQSRLSQARSGYASEGNTFNSRMEEYGQINEHIDNLNNLAQQKDNFDITHPLEAGGSIEGSLIALKGLQHATLGTAEKPTFLGRGLNKLGQSFDKSKLNLLNNDKRGGWAKNLKSTAEDLRGKANQTRLNQSFRQGQKRTGGTQEGEELGEGKSFVRGQTQQEQQNQAIDELRTKMRGDSGYRDDEGGVDGLFSGERGGSYRADDTREGDFDDARQSFKYDPDEADLNRVNTATEGVANENSGVVGDFDKTIGLKVKTKPWMRAQPARDIKGGADYENQEGTAEIGDAREALGLNRGQSVLKSIRETGGMGGEDFDAVEPANRVVNLGADTEATSGSVNYGGRGLGTTVKIFKASGGRAGATVDNSVVNAGAETTSEAEHLADMGSRAGSFASRQISNVRNIGQSAVEEGGRLKQNLGDLGGRLKQNLGDFVGRQKASFNEGMTRGTGAVENATEGAGEAGADAIADLGTTAGSEIGAGTLDAVAGGLEVAGAGLDATGIGAGAGLVVGAVGLAAGAYGAYESGKGVYEFIKQDLLHKADNTMTSLAKPMISLAQKGLGVAPTSDTAKDIHQTSNSW